LFHPNLALPTVMRRERNHPLAKHVQCQQQPNKLRRW
jgi:hypothetical protein